MRFSLTKLGGGWGGWRRDPADDVFLAWKQARL